MAVATFLAFTFAFPLIKVSSTSNSCSIPNFDPQPKIDLPSPRRIISDDFNKDGKADLAVVNSEIRVHDTISILLGKGNGGFLTPTIIATGIYDVAAIASGDLNADGNPDLAIANTWTDEKAELAVLLGNGSGGFSSPAFIRLAPGQLNQMTTVAIGDVNGDGKLDLMATSGTFGQLSVLFGKGDGTFTFFKNFPTGGSWTFEIVFRDFNGDGKGDLAFANGGYFGAGSVDISLGDGAGNFGAPSTAATVGAPQSLAVADFNGDGKLDVATDASDPNTLINRLTILIGDAAGHLGAPAIFGHFAVKSIVAADFNADGKVDLAAKSGTSIVIFTGDGSGSFTPVANYPGVGPFSTYFDENRMVSADFNGDTRPDLAAGFYDENAVSVFVNACGSPPGTQLSLDTGSRSLYEGTPVYAGVVRTGDITGTTSFQFESADGTALAPQDYDAVSGSMTLAPGEIGETIRVPIVGDNLSEPTETLKLSIFNVSGATLGSPATTTISILDNEYPPYISISDVSVNEGNSGTTNAIFKVTLNHPSSFPITMNYATADGDAKAGPDYEPASGTLTFNPEELTREFSVIVNGDTRSEVNEKFFVNLSNADNGILLDAQGQATILDDDASCPSPSFGSTTDFSVGVSPYEPVAADLNLDGKEDLAFISPGSSSVSILLGNGAGGFSIRAPIAVGAGPIQIVAVDLNLDQKMDLITANRNEVDSSDPSFGISILLGDGTGGFSVNTIASVSSIEALTVADFNSDNKPDLAILSYYGNKVSVMFGNGAGGFGAPTESAVEAPFSVTSGDLNGDGKPDLAVNGYASNSVSILLNTGNGVFSSAAMVPLGSEVLSEGIGDLNGDGKADLAVLTNPNSLTILLGNGAGGFSQSSAMKFGVHPFRVKVADLNGDGWRDLAVQDPANATSGSGGVWVLFGNGAGAFTTPAKYSIGGDPISVVAGDFNNDGKLDLVAPTESKIALLLNTCAGNSIDQTTSLVRQHYLDFLNREPDQAGWDFWISQIAGCDGDPQCIEVRRVDVSASFFQSIEFQNNGYLVERLHKVAYGDATGNSTFGGAHQLTAPIVRFNEFLQGTQRIGQGVIVLQTGWAQALENNKQAYALEFVQTARFATAFPTTITPAQFVDKLNQNAGMVLSAAERTSAINLFGAAADSSNVAKRAQAVRMVAEDQDLYNAEYNRAFVLAEYFGYLRRNPNDLPESTLDYTGYDFWLTKLNQFNGNYIQAEMVKAFLSSIEYRQRFGS